MADKITKLTERIKWRHIQRAYEIFEPHLKAQPIKLLTPEKGRVLVLAPHIDDDIIGAGGSLIKHALAGDEIKVIYFSDCTEMRINEAKEAAGIIGIKQLEFFDYKSKTLLKHPEIADRLSAIITAYKPEIVYLPSMLDRHKDHITVNYYLSLLYGKYKYTFTVYAFEVWTTVIPNLLIDVSEVMNKKKEAISKYKSQLQPNNWLEAAPALNRYRGVTSGIGLYAEGFIRYSIKEYSGLIKKVYGA